MTTALNFYKKYSKRELVEISMEISTNPDNQETSNDSIYVLTPSARKKLNAIAQAIAWHMEDEREKSGNPVPVSGYSGRKSK